MIRKVCLQTSNLRTVHQNVSFHIQSEYKESQVTKIYTIALWRNSKKTVL